MVAGFNLNEVAGDQITRRNIPVGSSPHHAGRRHRERLERGERPLRLERAGLRQ
jgi:hypothetical protein